MRKGRRVALPLADRAEPCNRGPRRVNANFAAIEHTKPEDVAVLYRTCTDDLGEERQANAHQLAGFTRFEVLDTLRLFSAQPA